MNIKDEVYENLIETGKDLEQLGLDFEKSDARDQLRKLAKEVLTLASQLRPRDPEPLKWLGYVYYHDDDLGRAEELFREGLEMAGDEGVLQFGNPLGNIYRARGNFKKAIEWYKKVGDEESHPVHIANIARVYDRWGKRDKAVEYAERGLEMYEESPEEFADLLKENLVKLKEEGYDWDEIESNVKKHKNKERACYKAPRDDLPDTIRKELEQ